MDRQFQISGYEIHGFGLRLYCKITEYAIHSDDYKCTMSFGTGLKRFCLIASYSKKNPFEIYLDRVEKKDNCITNDKLHLFENGMAKLVKVSLWTIKQLYPHVTKYTLQDDSQILCDNENPPTKMHMAYDYILKYNETWYQSKFQAELPGFISKHKNGQLTTTIAEPGSLMDLVSKSFQILDEPIVPLSLVKDVLPDLLSYKDEYESSTTPRKFINTLRTSLGNEYCTLVGKWLNQYMLYLRVDIIMSQWYILSQYITKPTTYSASKLSAHRVSRVLNGGSRKTRKRHSYAYGIVSDGCLSGHVIHTRNECI